MKKSYLFLILSIFIMILIFIFSSQQGEASYALSEKVSATVSARKVLTILVPDSVAAVAINIRKWAHIYLYFFLGMNVMFTINKFAKIRLQSQSHTVVKAVGNVSMAVCICFLLACADEFHQYFIPGRTASIFDIRFDACGFIPGILIALLGSFIISKIRTLISSHLIQIR